MSDPSNLHPLTTGTDLSPAPFEDTVEPRLAVVGTDFLMFGVGGGANVEAQVDYQNDPQRPTGNLPGLARSNFNNKAIRQGTFVAHSLCLWISQQLTLYIPDDGNDIAWIGEFSSALAQFVLGLIPAGPNLGAYLPLAGGNMSGNITFSSGITTILSNNTWYYARDTGGTARGLIVKSSDNNIYINDGSCPYVMFNGSPILNNNTWYGNRSTTGSLHGIVGLLSDNATHLASGPNGNIYLDCNGAGSIWANSNIVVPNSSSFYGKTTDGNARDIIGINSGNELRIGAGHTWVTSINSGGGQYIYMRTTTNVQGQLIVNQYSYLNGGGRAYIPGGNDPWQIYADQGHYSRTHYIVGNTRDWTAGCLLSGEYAIADETAAAIRFEIDLDGHGHFYRNLYVNGDVSLGGTTVTAFHATSWAQIDGGLTVYGGINIASGNFSVSGGTWMYGGVNIWNGLTVQSGNLQVNAAAQVNGGLTVYNSLNMASGTMWVNGPLFAYSNIEVSGGLHIGGLSWLVDGGGNWLTSGGNLNFYGWVQGGYVKSTGDGSVNGNWTAGGLYCNYFQDAGNALIYGQCQVNSTFLNYGWAYFYNITQCTSDFYARARLYIGGTGGLYDGGSNWINCNANFNIAGSLWCVGSATFINGVNIYGGATVYSGRLTAHDTNQTYMYDSYGQLLRLSFATDNGPYNQHYADVHFFASRWPGYTTYWYLGSTGTFNATGAISKFSAREVKTNIVPYVNGLASIRQLNPVTYNYIQGTLFASERDEALIGLIADEAEPYVPEIVGETVTTVNGEERTISTMMDSLLIYAVINSIKELADRLEALEVKA